MFCKIYVPLYKNLVSIPSTPDIVLLILELLGKEAPQRE
jgi:hypothetical protein